MIDWKAVDVAPEGIDVLFTGYNYNNPKAGRWVVSGQRYGDTYEGVEGEHLVPTHYADLNLPEN